MKNILRHILHVLVYHMINKEFFPHPVSNTFETSLSPGERDRIEFVSIQGEGLENVFGSAVF